MRYAWQWRSEIRRIPLILRPFWPAIAAILRSRDRKWAKRVDIFVANSHNVARRIESLYERDATVVYPPIDTGFWTPGDGGRADYFLCAGRLVAYKRVDVALRAARRAGVQLVVAGGGPELHRLRKLARGASVRFVVDPDATTLRTLYRHARALVHPGVEDFGMTLVEAQACATPVIAFAEGGAVEAVIDGRTGLLYEDPSVPALARILRSFNPATYDPDELRRHAEAFGLERFDSEIKRIVDGATSQ
jgi:glycosyltransferase involved in cell wall biosynthesis